MKRIIERIFGGIIILALLATILIRVESDSESSEQKYLDIKQFRREMTSEEYYGIRRFKSVLERDEKISIISYLNGERTNVTLSIKECLDYIDAVHPVEPEYSAKIKEIASCDLNKDGQNEIIILIENNDGQYLILQKNDDVVNGALVNYRSFNPIYENGIYGVSGGASDNEWRQFVSTDLAQSELICYETTENTTMDVPKYFIGEKEVDEKEYYKLNDSILSGDELRFYQVKA